MEILADRVIRTQYGQLDLLLGPDAYGYDGDYDKFFAGQSNGLVGAASGTGSIYIPLSTWWDVGIRMVLLDGEPALDTDSWEYVVEVSVAVTTDTPGWMTWADNDGGPLALPQGSYRLRVSAQDRAAAIRTEYLDQERVMSHYLFEFWPAPPSPDAVLYRDENA